MYKDNHHLHFIGIGGVGMAGIAEILHNLGYSVSGSDIRRGALVEHLLGLGTRVEVGHRAENLPAETSVVVVSSAIDPTNPEILAAQERGIPIIPRAEMLAELMRMKYGIAVAGSHGKTTTTSMIAKLLIDTGFDPTVIVGGRVLSQASGAKLGTGEYLVAEADESDGSFCLLRPAIAIVTNIDVEHLNHYGSFGALEEAFSSFMASVPFYGLVVACGDDPVVSKLTASLKRRVLHYGLSPEHEIHARDILIHGRTTQFSLYVRGERWGEVRLPVPGSHMVSNSLASLAVALEAGADIDRAVKALEDFPGVSRRSEVVLDQDGILVVDDYAHHPTEISATLSALKRGQAALDQKSRIVALFQPHRFSRTRELFSEFLECFSDADEVIVGDIYPGGEEPIAGIDAKKLATSLQHSQVSYVSELNDCVEGLSKKLNPGDIVVTLGAGSVGNVAHRLAQTLRK